MAAAIKMDELMVSWLGNDTVYENVQKLVESYRATTDPPPSPQRKAEDDETTNDSPRGVIPPFYPKEARPRRRRKNDTISTTATWLPAPFASESSSDVKPCAREQLLLLRDELVPDTKTFTVNDFTRVTKEVFGFPSFFNGPLFGRILLLWNAQNDATADSVTMEMMQWFWLSEMQNFDSSERFFKLLKQPEADYIARDDFLPYIKELLNDHPVSMCEEILFLFHSVELSSLSHFLR